MNHGSYYTTTDSQSKLPGLYDMHHVINDCRFWKKNHLPSDRNDFVGPLGHTQYMVVLNTIAIYVFVHLTLA